MLRSPRRRLQIGGEPHTTKLPGLPPAPCILAAKPLADKAYIESPETVGSSLGPMLHPGTRNLKSNRGWILYCYPP